MSKETKRGDYNFAFLDEGSKREIRRAVLHAIAVPGYQVPFCLLYTSPSPRDRG